ncbi:MAG TPA: ethylbenzene dehydrogenase-related protein [Acidimicrobiia bacterium]
MVASTTSTPDGEGSSTTTTVAAQTDRTLAAPRVDGITVDGSPDDWDGIPMVSFTLEPIIDKTAEPHGATVQVAHDDSYVYVLFTVDDDFEWSDVDPHYSGAPAVMWAIEDAAGPHMGGDDPSGHPALGMVDIWYWRLDCLIGVEAGGAVHGPGSGDPGNDDTCNLDDEWASDPETHEDDLGAGAENSLLGVFGHSNPSNDSPGTWYFEFRRPLSTGDGLDAQFSAGSSARLALAYWDPDSGQNGWCRQDHVQSSNQGWIEVVFE